MITFKKLNKKLVLCYTSYFMEATNTEGEDWISERLSENGSVSINRVFTFCTDHLLDDNSAKSLFCHGKAFLLGISEGEYYRINKNILNLKHDLFLHKKMSIQKKTFYAAKDISIFSKIDSLVSESIIIGGSHPHAIPKEDFYALLKVFPNATELKHYTNARIVSHLQNYFSSMPDKQKIYENYIKKKDSKLVTFTENFINIKEVELQKYIYLYQELTQMLESSDSILEIVWQDKIAEIILLLYPKYIRVVKELKIKDYYTNKTRKIDFALFDSNGAVDIIEIKRPDSNHPLSRGKYRENFIPHRELSGSIMQVEKYIFHLTKCGKQCENNILLKLKHKFPIGFKINIANPQGIIILGRDKDFSNEQKHDFEIIKRKYSRIIDIMTYDDLLRRLHNTIEAMKISLQANSL